MHSLIENTDNYKACEKMAINVSNSKAISVDNKKYCNLTVDYKTDNRWSHLLKRKKYLGKP